MNLKTTIYPRSRNQASSETDKTGFQQNLVSEPISQPLWYPNAVPGLSLETGRGGYNKNGENGCAISIYDSQILFKLKFKLDIPFDSEPITLQS
jgi:hypothetical protein